MKISTKSLIMALGLTACGSANAASMLDLTVVELDGNKFNLLAEVTGDVTGGIAGYNLIISGSDKLFHRTPKYITRVFSEDEGEEIDVQKGFTAGRGSLTGDGALFAGQNSTDALTLVYGLGEESGGEAGKTWESPILLAFGRFSGDFSNVKIDGSTSAANVWDQSSGTGAHAVDGVNVSYVPITPVPEPASIAMLGLGALAMIRRRK